MAGEAVVRVMVRVRVRVQARHPQLSSRLDNQKSTTRSRDTQQSKVEVKHVTQSPASNSRRPESGGERMGVEGKGGGYLHGNHL